MNKADIIAKIHTLVAEKRCWLDTTEEANVFYSDGLECDGTTYTIEDDGVLASYSSEYGAYGDRKLTFAEFLSEVSA